MLPKNWAGIAIIPILSLSETMTVLQWDIFSWKQPNELGI